MVVDSRELIEIQIVIVSACLLAHFPYVVSVAQIFLGVSSNNGTVPNPLKLNYSLKVLDPKISPFWYCIVLNTDEKWWSRKLGSKEETFFFLEAQKKNLLPSERYFAVAEIQEGKEENVVFVKWSAKQIESRITIYCFPIFDPFLYRRVISVGVSTTSSFPQEN